MATNPTNGRHTAKNQAEELAKVRAKWGAVVSTVTVASGVDGATEQVGVNDGVGATEQMKVTLPLKSPLGFTVTLPVADCPALTVLGDSAEAVSEKSGGAVALNVAVTDSAACMVRLQASVPEQLPPQPEKIDPEAGEAVKVTDVPGAKFAAQELLHLIPGGLLVMVPAPLPVSATERVGRAPASPSMTVTFLLFVFAA